jgi:hypothetical protein
MFSAYPDLCKGDKVGTATYSKGLPDQKKYPESQFLVPDWRDKVVYDIGLLYWPVQAT